MRINVLSTLLCNTLLILLLIHIERGYRFMSDEKNNGNDAQLISMYGANFSLHTGLHDIVLNFQDLDMSNITDGVTPIKTKCSILVTPSHLKQISKIIDDNLRMYEETIAKIPDLNQDTIESLKNKGLTVDETRNE